MKTQYWTMQHTRLKGREGKEGRKEGRKEGGKGEGRINKRENRKVRVVSRGSGRKESDGSLPLIFLPS